MAIVFVFLMFVAIRGLVEQTKRDLARWRQRPARHGQALHTAGYWAHQLLNGFPTARHGLTSGWHQGRKAHLAALRGMHQASAEHAEARAQAGPELAGYRQRRRAAWDEINRQREEEEARQAGFTYHYGHESGSWEVQAEDEDTAVAGARQASYRGDGRFRAVERPVAGGPDRVLAEFDSAPSPDPAPEYRFPDPEPGPEPEPARADAGGPEAPAPPGPVNPLPAEGTTVMGDINFAGVMSRMDQSATQAEQHRAEAEQSTAYTEEHLETATSAKAWAAETADAMQSLEVDPDTLAAMADHLAALDAAESAASTLNEQMGVSRDAWAQVAETAGDVKGRLLAGGHGALADAHANAAAGGAQKDFYTE